MSMTSGTPPAPRFLSTGYTIHIVGIVKETQWPKETSCQLPLTWEKFNWSSWCWIPYTFLKTFWYLLLFGQWGHPVRLKVLVLGWRENRWNLECNISGQHFRIFGHILKVQTRHFLDRSYTWERHSVRKRQHNMTILASCWAYGGWGRGREKNGPFS